MKRSLWLFVMAVALITMVASVGCQSQPTASSKTVDVTVALTEFTFNPDTITVKVGDHVKVTLDNTKGTLKHTMVQPDLNINASVEAGQKSTFEFTATKAGTFSFDCDVPGHKEAGMIGKIVVQP